MLVSMRWISGGPRTFSHADPNETSSINNSCLQSITMPYSIDSSSDSDTLLGHGSSPDRLSVEKSSLAKFPLKRRWCSASITTPLILHLCLATLYTTLFFAFWDYQGWKPSARHKSGLLAYSM